MSRFSYLDSDGLMYLVDRYYDPAIGQVLSVDRRWR